MNNWNSFIFSLFYWTFKWKGIFFKAQPVAIVVGAADVAGDGPSIQIVLEHPDPDWFFLTSDLAGVVGENSDGHNQIWNIYSNSYPNKLHKL